MRSSSANRAGRNPRWATLRSAGVCSSRWLALLLASACHGSAAPPPAHPALPVVAPAAAEDPSARASRSFDAILDDLLADDPAWGRMLGLHAYDGRVTAYSASSIADRIARLRRARSTLLAIQQTQLNADAALDAALLRSSVEGYLFQYDAWDQWRKNPLFYQTLFGVNDYLDRDYAPLPERARKLVEHEEAALREVEHVLENLVPPLPRPIVETAIKVYAGYAEYLRGDVVQLLAGVGDAAFQQRFAKVNAALAARAEAISSRLERVELPRGDTGYALGEQRYLDFVRIQEGLELPLPEFARMAEADLSANKLAYEQLARKVAQTRPSATELLPAASRMTDAARAFLAQRQLVTMPEARPPVVRETPPFMRWNQAFLVASGPFERAGLESYYYITLPDPAWPKPKQHEYLMTHGTLVSTTVHETYPGHFLQGAWTRLAPTRVQKAVTSYSFSEGWAHYVEQLMVDEGFEQERPETRLGQLSDALLRDCRFVVSIGLHTANLSLADAERRFVHDCHQDQASAHEQAVRGTFDPGYFAYTLGKLQILALRQRAQQRLGPRFTLKGFHDALLAHGTSAVPLIQERVLAELEAGPAPASPASP